MNHGEAEKSAMERQSHDAEDRPQTGRELFLSVVPSGKVELTTLSAAETGNSDVIRQVLHDVSVEGRVDGGKVSDIISMLLFRLASTEARLCDALARTDPDPL